MDSVGDVVSDSIESDYKVKSVQGFTSLKRDQWEVPIELDVSMPVSALQAFQVKRMLIKVCPKGPVDGSTEGVANAFDVLKEAQRTYASLPKEREELHSKDRLYNALLQTMRQMGVGFKVNQIEKDGIGYEVVDALWGALWYLDPYWSKLERRSIRIPRPFSELQNYRDFKSQHRKETEITSSDLKIHIDKLADILMMPLMMSAKFQSFRNTVSELLTETYAKRTGLKPAMLRNMHEYLTGSVGSESAEQNKVDINVCKFLLEGDDMNLVADLRENNGKLRDPKYNPFWEEMSKLLEAETVVHDRRHTQTQYLPFAMSVEHLRQKVLDRLPEGTSAPSVSWLRLHFMPSNPYTKSAMNYTGTFDVKYSVQQRLLRAEHDDADYCLHLFVMMKHMAVRYREYSSMQCLDDKAIIPVGECHHPISTGVRANRRGLLVPGAQLWALDHDFHICGIVPSVCFLVDIPESARDSFYDGQVHVHVKDKIFQPSSPSRHAAETVKIVKTQPVKPILFRYTDGGPDHRTNYRSVQLAAVCEFIALDLDMMVLVRTAPSQSFNNPAERMMSLLNIALQNVALARNPQSDSFEAKMKKLGSIKAVRNAASKDSSLKDELLASMEEPTSLVKQRFSQLKRKGSLVVVHDPASEEDICQMQNLLQNIDDSVDLQSVKKLSDHENLQEFFDNHCCQRHYSFQIKKCSSETCSYCTLHPPRLPQETFKDLHFLPDPTPSGKGQDYMDFEEAYGSLTTDEHRPSLLNKPAPTSTDKEHKGLFVGAKARSYIICGECGNRRVVYSATSLSPNQELALLRLQEEVVYICGSPLFLDGPEKDKLVVREGLNCESQMETTYYSGIVSSFPKVCFHCGDPSVFENEDIKLLKEQWGIVRPICEMCYNSGKRPATRNALKIKKKRM